MAVVAGIEFLSPMPFGSDPFRDLEIEALNNLCLKLGHQCLSAVIPFGTTTTSNVPVHLTYSHQCLSAVIPFGTGKHAGKTVAAVHGHQCLSAVIPFGTTHDKTPACHTSFCHQCLSAVIPFGTQYLFHLHDLFRVVTNAFRQ